MRCTLPHSRLSFEGNFQTAVQREESRKNSFTDFRGPTLAFKEIEVTRICRTHFPKEGVMQRKSSPNLENVPLESWLKISLHMGR